MVLTTNLLPIHHKPLSLNINYIVRNQFLLIPRLHHTIHNNRPRAYQQLRLPASRSKAFQFDERVQLDKISHNVEREATFIKTHSPHII